MVLLWLLLLLLLLPPIALPLLVFGVGVVECGCGYNPFSKLPPLLGGPASDVRRRWRGVDEMVAVLPKAMQGMQSGFQFNSIRFDSGLVPLRM